MVINTREVELAAFNDCISVLAGGAYGSDLVGITHNDLCNLGLIRTNFGTV